MTLLGLPMDAWWVWIAAAILLAILEVFAPGFVFLGFAAGAAITGAVVAWSPEFAAGMTSSLPWLMVFFAVASLLSWVVMRASFGARGAQVKTFSEDIND